MCHEKNAVLWESVPEADKAAYYANFGENAPTPDGTIVLGGGFSARQYFFGFSTVKGTAIIVL